ncbi:metal dependent phosphohydrolase [Peptoclostridium acidaminophilum DSM 3953]|uniref:bis(5'-nucleosyl)-tetraphosphatase (symmetrical) n=2 Tax=Peptoclostridium acidaminophilum TaxID=1731 RepID=W8TF56_PEPAC|nr:metal dependent phosphohydrolase [Peptoclostridium acidaminophilum DSM 3953]
MNICDMSEKLKGMLSHKRYKHTMGVLSVARRLAERYNADLEKVELSALLHDCGKDMDSAEMHEYVSRNDIKLDDIEARQLELAHGAVGAYLAMTEFGVADSEVLSAIRFHTTGKIDMTNVEKIVYLADFIEEGRKYPGVQTLRELSFEDLDSAILLSFDNTIRHVISQKKILHTRTVEARNFILEQMENMRGAK